MKKKTKNRVGAVLLLANLFVFLNSYGQVPPLVYSVENTGVDCTAPPLPVMDDLPVVEPLTDPFEWSDGSGRDTTFEAWTKRRNEIKTEIEHYEIGEKPTDWDTLMASIYDGNTLIVQVVRNNDTLTLSSQILFPPDSIVGPHPIVIGMGSANGSLPSQFFTDRNIARMAFNFSQVMEHTQVRGQQPINDIYPELENMGAYSAWPWGVSRLIDGLQIFADSLNIDMQHIGVTGCSFAGKMALWSGALDERIALTIVQESGGGGAAAWRIMETLPGVERLSATNSSWFERYFKNFSGKNVSKLPHDHHELMALVAPRAMLVLGNPSQVWLGEEAGYTTCEATQLVYENFGIGDRFGYSFITDHAHCAIPTSQYSEIEAFIDKFMLDSTNVNTEIRTRFYDNVIPEYWTDWWGKGEPHFPVLDRGDAEEYWIEAECGDIGPAWNVRLDTNASNVGYVVPKAELKSSNTAPTDDGATIKYTFTVEQNTTYYLYARVNCPADSSDSYFFKMDDADRYLFASGLKNDGWEWAAFDDFELTAGEHTLTFAYRETGAQLDKICISAFRYPPGMMGEPAESTCTPDTTTVEYNPPQGLKGLFTSDTYELGQNFPNPATGNTIIPFEIPHHSYVSVKVYSMLGDVVSELAGREYAPGKHTIEFSSGDFSNGVYFYTLQAGKYTASRKMIIHSE